MIDTNLTGEVPGRSSRTAGYPPCLSPALRQRPACSAWGVSGQPGRDGWVDRWMERETEKERQTDRDLVSSSSLIAFTILKMSRFFLWA